MKKISFFILLQAIILKGFAQQISYSEKAAELNHMIYTENVDVEKLNEFENRYLNPSKIPFKNKEFHELIDAYIYLRFTEKKYRKTKGLNEMQSYLDLSTSFKNDTINQLGIINFSQYSFSNRLIDRTTFRTILDSVLMNSYHETIKNNIRNIKFRNRFSTHIPDFQYSTVEHEKIKLSDIEKNYILLDFWFTSCASCIKAFPKLDQINTTYSDLEVVCIDPFDPIPRINEFLENKSYDWRFISIAAERNSISEQQDFFNISAMPRYILINNNLEVLDYDLKLEDIEKYID